MLAEKEKAIKTIVGRLHTAGQLVATAFRFAECMGSLVELNVPGLTRTFIITATIKNEEKKNKEKGKRVAYSRQWPREQRVRFTGCRDNQPYQTEAVTEAVYPVRVMETVAKSEWPQVMALPWAWEEINYRGDERRPKEVDEKKKEREEKKKEERDEETKGKAD